MTLSPELTALRDEAMRVSCLSWAIQKRWGLTDAGPERTGPCPKCGSAGHSKGTGPVDRFSINIARNIFNCRRCGIAGSGVIDLVMQTQDVVFIEACEIITGHAADAPIDEAKAEENRRALEAEERRRAAAAERYRERARAAGNAIWREGQWIDFSVRSIARDYLEIVRAIDLGQVAERFPVLRFHPELPWTEAFTDERGNTGWRTLHIGPALMAAVQLPDGRFGAVHMTWIDLSQPKGKLVLPPDDKGEARPSKKVRGTKKGGAIRLYTPAGTGSRDGDPEAVGRAGALATDRTERGARRIVMGEGLESTGTPLCHAFEPDTAYWAGVDLGNMGGLALKLDGRTIHDQPDMEDRPFLPPDWCEELVYLGEGDDAEVHSEEKCIRGLRRAKRIREAARAQRPELPPLSIVYVPPGEPGKDMNDIAMDELGALSSPGALSDRPADGLSPDSGGLE
ncbi:MAG: hypothetical protein HY834_08985 [Devosia nanyangense]|uniref:DUF7146 domain-containing protein n=1 Tax=Devosia nanyangense TaxID=1228055 RepID=A0A933L1K9_9HYPH|nr:hypothetical protein [Devosia nanyangense]